MPALISTARCAGGHGCPPLQRIRREVVCVGAGLVPALFSATRHAVLSLRDNRLSVLLTARPGIRPLKVRFDSRCTAEPLTPTQQCLVPSGTTASPLAARHVRAGVICSRWGVFGSTGQGLKLAGRSKKNSLQQVGYHKPLQIHGLRILAGSPAKPYNDDPTISTIEEERPRHSRRRPYRGRDASRGHRPWI